MKCDRCQVNDAAYRVFTDALNIDVCASCAQEARQLNIPTEDILIPDWQKATVQNKNLPVDLMSWSRTHRNSHR